VFQFCEDGCGLPHHLMVEAEVQNHTFLGGQMPVHPCSGHGQVGQATWYTGYDHPSNHEWTSYHHGHSKTPVEMG